MRLNALDVFAGCGGLSLGLAQSGWNIVAACEVDKWAAETYTTNHPKTSLFNQSVHDLTSKFLKRHFRGEIDLIAGGPPCQGFSVSGKRQYGVSIDSNHLLFEFIRIVGDVRPSMFLMENVRGFATARVDGKIKALPALKEAMQKLGYHVYVTTLQAADYGVPQFRTRIFVVGSLSELPYSPFPSPTHSATGLGKTKQHRSVGEAISDLPRIEAREGTDGPQRYTESPANSYQRYLRRGSSSVYNHEAMKHTRRLVQRFAAIPPGGSGYRIGRTAFTGTEPPVTVYKMNNQRLIEHLPSLCITANFQSNYIHPILHRNLTAREAARIMSFPDAFILRGKRTLMSSSLLVAENRTEENYLSQYNQLGNAVPPLLAKLIADRLGTLISGNHHSSRLANRVPHQLSLSIAS